MEKLLYVDLIRILTVFACPVPSCFKARILQFAVPVILEYIVVQVSV
jgi:hypothetical protein